MPIKNAAKKYVKVTKRKTAANKTKKVQFRTVVKETLDFVSQGKKDEAKKSFVKVQKALDKAAKTGLIKKNAASRKKSRLAKKIKGLEK